MWFFSVPTDLTLTRKNATSLIISWKEPQPNIESIESYSVSVVDSKAREWPCVFSANDKYMCSLNGLPQCLSLSVNVRACAHHNNCGFSASDHITTGIVRKYIADNVKYQILRCSIYLFCLTALGKFSVKVKSFTAEFKLLNPLNSICKLSNITITATSYEKPSDSQITCVILEPQNGDSPNCKMKNLKPDTTYFATAVSCSTDEIGCSDTSTPIHFHTSPDGMTIFRFVQKCIK